jgi:hypothetical protein
LIYMTLTNSSITGSAPAPEPANTAKANSIYGTPGDATRMHRISSIAEEALSTTTGSAGESAISDGAFTLGEAKRLGGVTNVGAPGSPGFPGLTGSSYPDGTQPAA